MDVASIVECLDGGRPGEAGVVLRLHLVDADEATGTHRVVSSFVRRSSMPVGLASPLVGVALELNGERRVCQPTQVTWDETHRLCIIEVEWLVASAHASREPEEAALWSA